MSFIRLYPNTLIQMVQVFLIFPLTTFDSNDMPQLFPEFGRLVLSLPPKKKMKKERKLPCANEIFTAHQNPLLPAL